MMIRPATEADIPEILAIYNEVIANSTAVYREEPFTLEDRLEWFGARRERGFPVLVACEEERVVGFSSFADFRMAPCYRYTVEQTVHVHVERRGMGIGAELVEALFPYAKALGMHVMIAAVDAGNERAVRFHESLGFERVAHFRQVGFKFGQWLDLLFLQRMVRTGSA